MIVIEKNGMQNDVDLRRILQVNSEGDLYSIVVKPHKGDEAFGHYTIENIVEPSERNLLTAIQAQMGF